MANDRVKTENFPVYTILRNKRIQKKILLVKMFIFLFGFIYNKILRARHIYDAYCEHMENIEKELVKLQEESI